MNNPFYIQPVDVSSGLQGLGQMVMAKKELDLKKQQQAQKEERLKAFQDAASKAKTPMDFANLAGQFPEYSQAANLMVDAETKQQGMDRDLVTSLYKKASLSPNPADVFVDWIAENPNSNLKENIVTDIGWALGDPEQFREYTQKMWASADPEGFKAAMAAPESAYDRIGKIDPKMYTPDSVQAFYETGKYSDLKPRSDISEADRLKLETERAKLKTEELKQQQTAQKLEAEKAAKEAESTKKVQSANNALRLVRELNSPDSLDRLSGISGKLPSVAGSKASADEAKLQQLQSLLTLENLSMLSGVLTDKDMEILRSAATSLQPGMNKDLMRQELVRIESMLNDRIGSAVAGDQKSVTTQQQQAMDWLNANPNDPRAAGVRAKLQREGVM